MIALQGGQTTALDALMDRHASAVLNFCANYTGDRAWAEDIAQESFVTVYRKCDAFRRGARFLPWVFTIARNRAIDFMRRRGRPLPVPDVTDQDPHGDVVAEERDTQVRRALRALPENFRHPLFLSEIDEMPY
jgi:RNA polymerase sigma-70 factor (ECF subfamily)